MATDKGMSANKLEMPKHDVYMKTAYQRCTEK